MEPDRLVSHGPIVDTAALLRWPGTQCDVVIDEHFGDLVTSTAAARHLHGSLVVESMADSISVTGVLRADWEGECRRCLEVATGSVDVELQEIYERHPVEGETYELTADRVDLEPMLRELVTLTLPLAPLCREGCAGPAPDDFPTVVKSAPPGDDESVERPADPRWAALDELVFDDPTE